MDPGVAEGCEQSESRERVVVSQPFLIGRKIARLPQCEKGCETNEGKKWLISHGCSHIQAHVNVAAATCSPSHREENDEVAHL
jgi:hypothetical protein